MLGSPERPVVCGKQGWCCGFPAAVGLFDRASQLATPNAARVRKCRSGSRQRRNSDGLLGASRSPIGQRRARELAPLANRRLRLPQKGTDGADLPVRIGGRRSVWATKRFAGKCGARDRAWSELVGSAPPQQYSSGPIGRAQLRPEGSDTPPYALSPDRYLPVTRSWSGPTIL